MPFGCEELHDLRLVSDTESQVDTAQYWSVMSSFFNLVVLLFWDRNDIGDR
jgi:hypothetical protein